MPTATGHANNQKATAQRLIPFGIAAVGCLVAWSTLTFIGIRQQGSWPAAAAPFVWNRVALVHVACLLGLSLCTGRVLTTFLGRSQRVIIALVFLGLVFSLVSLAAADWISEMAQTATSADRHWIRMAWCWLLLSPWCGAAVARFQAGAAADRDRPPSSWLLSAADVVLAVVLSLIPLVHVNQLIERQTALLNDALVNQQDLSAWQIAQQLHLLGAENLLGRPAQTMVNELGTRVVALRQAVAADLPDGAEVTQRLERAARLYSLRRFDQVAATLAGLGDLPEAQLRLGLSAEAQQEFASAAEAYGRAIELLSQHDDLDAQQLRLLRVAMERRVNNLRRIGENRQAENELHAALKNWPQARDAWLFQLGFHYQMAGRTTEAIDFFDQAAAANPRLRPRADAAMATLQQQAEGCLLRPTRGATR